jgi:N-acetyl-anhydromuramyl-L-alanine amidase AmpD
MARYSGATWRPVQNFRAAGSVEQRGLVLHVQEGNNSPWGWFNNPESQASSDFWVGKDGRVEQYVNAGVDRAWAQANGNSYYCSVETEGYTGERLTDAQVDALARLYVWGHQTFGWPLVVVDSVSAHGFTWHGVGGAAWGNHPDCPGELRKGQRQAVIDRAKAMIGLVASRPYPGHVLRLHPGEQHDQDVKAVQEALNRHGARLVTDGWFGEKTRRAVVAYQAGAGLVDDGEVGRKTWASLFGGVA